MEPDIELGVIVGREVIVIVEDVEDEDEDEESLTIGSPKSSMS